MVVKLCKIDKPDDANIYAVRGQLIIELRSDWQPAETPYPQGALLATDLSAFPGGERRFERLFEPTPTRALDGAVMTQRPELFNAVVCQMPLLDMRRYHLLLAGASWMGEYGDPDDPAQWAFIGAYSPYHHVAPDKTYPRLFLTTSTRDDRVHPGHARKMAVRMQEQGHDVLYWENMEGGHAGAANNAQQALMWVLTYSFLLGQLK